MALTAPGIPLGLSAQTLGCSWCEFSVPHGFELHPLQGKACGEGSKDFITPTQALEAGKRQAVGTQALIKVRSWSIPLPPQQHSLGRQILLLSHKLPPFYPQTTETTEITTPHESTPQPAAPEHPHVEAPEGIIPPMFTHLGHVCK